MVSQYQVECFNSLEACRETWHQFESTAEHYLFQSYSWQHCWYDKVGHTKVEPRIIVVRQGSNATVLLLPLCIQRRRGLRELTFMGGLVTDYHAPMIAADWQPSEIEFVALWQQIRLAVSGFDLVWFEKQPKLVNNVVNPLSRLFQKEMALSHSLTLDAPWQELYQHKVSKRIRADSRRQLKRLNEVGELKFEVEVTAERASQIIDKMIEQKRSRYKNMGVYDLFDEVGYQQFFTSLHQHWQAPGKVHISAFSVNDTIIATHWGLVDQARFYYLMPSYEAGDWAKFSAGRLLLEEMIQWSIDNGLQEFDFSFGDEAYKKSWCDVSTPLFLSVQANSILGKSAYLAWSLSEKLKSIKWLKALVQRVRGKKK
ncbi:MAG: CelD/BcsL family acetyltransferase involved in cellulose biosynthesis [Paracoccaceae bacterium]|jgi:CelD/BcsL family acetyltransferase involved in cellulose biosynthesis